MSGILAVTSTPTSRVEGATHGVAAVGALPLGIRLNLVWYVVSICQLGCMRWRRLMCLPSVFFRADIVWSVSSSEIPLANSHCNDGQGPGPSA